MEGIIRRSLGIAVRGCAAGLLTLLFCSSASAQSYTSSAVSWQWDDVSATGRSLDVAEGRSAEVLLPFEIPFFGRPVDRLIVGDKGYVLTAEGSHVSASSPTPLPTTSDPNGFIAPFWADLDSSGGGIYVDTLGTEPHRRLVIQWQDVRFVGESDLAPGTTFQLLIHEGTGYLEIRIQAAPANPRLHTIGVQNLDGDDFLQIDHSAAQLFETAWVLKGPNVFAPPSCGVDRRYACYDVPPSFDPVRDEITWPAAYVTEIDFTYEWQEVPAANRIAVNFDDPLEPDAIAVALPFPFRFYETSYDTIWIGDWGVLSFLAPPVLDALPPPLPVPGTPTDAIVAPAWTPLAPDFPGCGSLHFGTLGPLGQRKFVVTWEAVCTLAEVESGIDLHDATFQVVFYEATNEIRFNYAAFFQRANRDLLASDVATATYEPWVDTTIGLEDATASRASMVLGGEPPEITTQNYFDYSIRFAYENRPNGTGAPLTEDLCRNGIQTLGPVEGTFPFRFYDEPPSDVFHVSGNGLLGLAGDLGLDESTPQGFPGSAPPDGMVSPGWAPLRPCDGGTIAYAVRGDPGTRRLVTEWNGIPQERVAPDGSTMASLRRGMTTQVVLAEPTGTLDLNVGEIEIDDTVGLAAGIEDPTASDGIGLLFAPAGAHHVVGPRSQKLVRHCNDASVTLGASCSVPPSHLQGACASQGVWTCVAGEAACSQEAFPAAEICNHVDDDCDGVVDDGVQSLFYRDDDGDGFGDADIAVSACAPPPGFVSDSNDCDDQDPTVSPGAVEVCNVVVDDDCDGQIDEGLGEPAWVDADGDGFGDTTRPVSICPGTPGHAVNPDDCDDTDSAVHPGATELCDGRDQDCNGAVDDQCIVPNEPPTCTGALAAPAVLWPPNGEFRRIVLSGATDPDGDPVTLRVTAVFQDEPLLGSGDGDTSPDARLVGDAAVEIRSERSGSGNGRVYQIRFDATDVHGAACDGIVTVDVPHDQDEPAIDDGATFPSTTP